MHGLHSECAQKKGIPVGPCTRWPPRNQKGGANFHDILSHVIRNPRCCWCSRRCFFLKGSDFWRFQAMPASRPPWAPGCHSVSHVLAEKWVHEGRMERFLRFPRKHQKLVLGFCHVSDFCYFCISAFVDWCTIIGWFHPWFSIQFFLIVPLRKIAKVDFIMTFRYYFSTIFIFSAFFFGG